MSWDTNETRRHPALETLIIPPTREISEGFQVRRALPSMHRRMVGPVIFLDQMGPAVFQAGKGLDVRPHPHIGLATVTYLFQGEVLHRDGLGTVQAIRPGEVNWMTAGRGIAHSERTAPGPRAAGGGLFGLQAWVALPKQYEEIEPSFFHHEASEIPFMEGEGVRMHLIAGSLHGKRSPVRTFSEMVYADVALKTGARFSLPAEHEERAIYLVEGTLEADGMVFGPGELLVFRPKANIVLRAASAARMVLLGGEPMDGPRYMYWNFVSSSKERLEVAKADWREGRFAPVPQETEFIPLPEEPPAPVRYP
ncbi:pirin family protein [Stigmatella aurantiaca]|uniref:Pirin n=1 Tax=Stigmatella aurantiaca (strain DW4/3-1) TaxID=378806 RepID=Q08Z42_STIAD|nr:pirin family protein [Stigmatella aurantiaca]ADO74500.1 Pirin family protein [Stigmatella aurantiaca DW4/3-1]EAU65728.1 pirin [Stigmatella aurantiaca DW4/3-1]